VVGQSRSLALDEIFDKVEIEGVARALGLQVETRGRRPRKALCPFHSDTSPSLNLYEGGKGHRAHYHCYSCGAHGDLVDLVKNVKNYTFPHAVDWLADLAGVRVPPNSFKLNTREATSSLADLIAKSNDPKFSAFCEERQFDPAFLRAQGVGLTDLSALVEQGQRDRGFADALIQAGLAR